MKSRRPLLVLLAAVFAAAPARPAGSLSAESFPFLDWSVPHRVEQAVVHYVYDGDTLQDAQKRAIRLLGVNTPEVAHPEHDKYANEPGGIEATRFTETLVRGKRVYLVIDAENSQDNYGRTLAVVFVRDGAGQWLCLNWELVREGFGAALVLPDNRLCVEPEWYRINAVSKRRRAEDFRVIARSFEKEGRRESAIETYQKAIRAFPDARFLYEDLGDVYRAMNLPGFSVDIALAYLERQPGDPEMRARLARAYEAMDQAGKISMVDYNAKAREEWRKLVGTKLDGEARDNLARLQTD